MSDSPRSRVLADARIGWNRFTPATRRSATFFGADTHPHVRFTTTDVEGAGHGTLRVRGEIEAAGRRAPLEFEAPVRRVDGELEVEATAFVDQRSFGMTFSPLGTVRTPTELRVKARLTPADR